MESGNPLLADALQTKDMAAVAFALRHGATLVPHEDDAVWLHRGGSTGSGVLLLFSDARRVPESLPAPVALTPAELRDALAASEATAVIFDVAGPHPMSAEPADIIRVLDA